MFASLPSMHVSRPELFAAFTAKKACLAAAVAAKLRPWRCKSLSRIVLRLGTHFQPPSNRIRCSFVLGKMPPAAQLSHHFATLVLCAGLDIDVLDAGDECYCSIDFICLIDCIHVL
jgi:hypothetical protein